MSTEARTIRPFVDFGEIGALFSDAVVRFGDQACPAASRVVFDGDEVAFRASSVVMEWAPGAGELQDAIVAVGQAVDALGYSRRELSLVVIASSSYLKAVDVVFEIPLSALSDLSRFTPLSESPRAAAFSAVHHGFSVESYVLLNQPVDPRSLYPSRQGTWLSRETFSFVTESISSLFRPTPLTAQARQDLQLGKRVTRFVLLDNHDPLRPFDEQDEPTLYVDEELLAHMNATARTPASKSAQLQLVMDFIRSVIMKASLDGGVGQTTYDDTEGSLVHRLIESATPKGASEEKQRVFEYIVTKPEWVTAYIEDALDIRKLLMQSLEGDD